MRQLRSIAGFLVVFTLVSHVTAVAEAEGPLTPEIRLDSIERLAEKLDDYVYPAKGKQMAERLTANVRDGKYDSITDFAEFGRAVTRDMFEMCGDRHLLIRYSPSDVAGVRARAALSGDERQRDSLNRKADVARDNFGFEKVEILPGNIGYLKLNRFEQAAYADETAFATMAFLSHASTLVIDLRHNNGGWNGMTQIICSYFFPFEELSSETMLWEVHRPYENTVTQTWTLPHVPGKRMDETPVYILTSGRTYSAAETFTDILQKRGRATVVGEKTRGGAHSTRGPEVLNDHYILKMPVGRMVNPVTGKNWEGVGIEPDIATDQDGALAAALTIIVEDLIAGNPDERFLNNLGYSYMERGRMEIATRIFAENVRLHPDSANCHDSLGEAFLKSGDHEQAAIHYRKSLELDPDNDNAVEMLARMAGEG